MKVIPRFGTIDNANLEKSRPWKSKSTSSGVEMPLRTLCHIFRAYSLSALKGVAFGTLVAKMPADHMQLFAVNCLDRPLSLDDIARNGLFIRW